MSSVTTSATSLAHEVRGGGAPIVLLHGLTFNRGTWSPVVERLAEEFRCVTIDLPGHGHSPGPIRPLAQVAEDLHRLLGALGIERPVVVGHSMGAVLATLYAASWPVAGVVDVDQSLDLRPFAQLVHKLEPSLHGDRFADAFEPFERSIGVQDLPSPERSRVSGARNVGQELVMGYFNEVLETSPEDLHTRVTAAARAPGVPWLGVFGRELDSEEKSLVELLPRAELEEWPGRGHLVHLVEPDRFAHRLGAFARHCFEPAAPYDPSRAANSSLFMGLVGRCLNGHDLPALNVYTDNPRVVASITRTVTGFPDLTASVEWLLADGDMVGGWLSVEGTHLGHWRGLAPTASRISVRGSLTVKVIGGKIADFWLCADWLRMYEQLGAAPR